MTDILLQIGATKLALSIALAAMVGLVQQRVTRPAIVHTLWLLVLGTLLVPAVVPLRVLPEQAGVEVVVVPGEGPRAVHNTGMSGHEMGPQQWLRGNGESLVVLAWLLGSAGFFGWTLVRTVRFQRKLTRAARPAPRLRRHAAEIGVNLGLRRVPRIYTTNARLRPMVWWTGGRVRILIPAVFLAELDETELRVLLAHELDARSLLRAVEVLSAAPVQRTPALASAADIGRDSKRLEKRLKAVLGAAPASDAAGWLRGVVRVALVCGLCVGLVYCDGAERVEAPETGQMAEPVAGDSTPGAPAREPDSFLFAPDTLRNWIVVWHAGDFLRGPGPAAIAVAPTTSCHLDAAAWNEGKRPVWECLVAVADDRAVLTEVPVTSISASDSLRLRRLLNRQLLSMQVLEPRLITPSDRTFPILKRR